MRDLERVYAAIPDGIDILVSHQPPIYNVSVVDESYQLANATMVIDLPDV